MSLSVSDKIGQVNERLGAGLENVKVVDTVYSLIELLEESGVDNADELVLFYFNVLVACAYGQVALDREEGSYEFGFEELSEVANELSEVLNVREASERLRSQLQVIGLRGQSILTVEDAGLRSMLVDDLATVSTALGLEFAEDAPVTEEVKESLKDESVSDGEVAKKIERLKGLSKIQAMVKNAVDDILSVYDFAFEAGYELDRYEGVNIGQDSVPMVVIQRDEAVQPFASSSYIAGNTMYSPINGIPLSLSRQVSLDLIYESELPVYFPYKILEFALGRKVTSRADSNHYAVAPAIWRSVKGRGEQGQRDIIKGYLTKRAWEYLVLVTDRYQDGLYWQDEMGYFGEGGAKRPMRLEDAHVYQGYMDKFRSSFCTFSVLKNHTSTDGDEVWASAEWVVSAPLRLLQPSEFTEGSSFYTEVFNGGGEVEEPLEEDIKGIRVRHYGHVANPAIAEAEPLFAYKALESLQNKGQKLSSSYQLLGKGLDGRILTFSNELRADVNAGAKLVLVYWAGSRSGKGVSISNGMAVSIVEKRPILGADGKPDTMVPYYIAFGGADEQGIPKGYFIQSGTFKSSSLPIKGGLVDQLDWDNSSVIMSRHDKLIPKWLRGSGNLVPERKYTGVWGDMAYYRHILLTLGIISLRATVRDSDKDLYEFLGGDGGILAIYDEMTNWITTFSSSKLNSNGGWFSKILSDAEVLDLQNTALDMSSGSMKEGKAKKERLRLSSMQDTLRVQAYQRDLYDNLDSSLQYLDGMKKAGFQNAESLRSSIYVVGQSFAVGSPGIPLPRNKNNDASSFKASASFTETIDPVTHFLMNLDTGFMIGYKGTESAQYWSDTSGSDTKKYLTETARRFAYIGSTSYETIRDQRPQDKDRVKSVKSASDGGAVYFKPYLILGDSKGDCIDQLEANLGSKAEEIKARNCDPTNPREWDDRVGVLGYLKGMGADDVTTSFTRGREIADAVVKKMGYDGTYLDFLLDMRPEWNFAVKDVVDAYVSPETVETRSERLMVNKVERLLGEILTSEGGAQPMGAIDSSSAMGTAFASNFVEDTGRVNTTKGINDQVEDELATGFGKLSPVAGEAPATELGRFGTNDGSASPKLSSPSGIQSQLDTVAKDLGVNPAILQEALARLLGTSVVNNGLGGSNLQSVSSYGTVDDLNQRSSMETLFNDHLVFNSDDDVYAFVAHDLRSYFGDLGRVKNIEVRGGRLYLNNQLYEPNFGQGVSFQGVSPYVHNLMVRGSYGELFDWGTLRGELEPYSLIFDSVEYAWVHFNGSIGNKTETLLRNAFNYYPSLQYIEIAGSKFKRAEFEKVLVSKQPFFSSYDRRWQVAKRTNTQGRNFRNRRWNQAKKHYNQGRTGRAVMSTLGTGVGLGIQGVAKTGGLVNSFFHSARKFGQEWSKEANRNK